MKKKNQLYGDPLTTRSRYKTDQLGKGTPRTSTKPQSGSDTYNKTPASTTCHKSTEPKTPRTACLIEAIVKVSDQISTLSGAVLCIGTRIDKLEKIASDQKKLTSEIDPNSNLLEEVAATKRATETVVESCANIQDKLEKNHETKVTKKLCELLIQGHEITWKRLINNRAISYWHGLQNYEKARLYQEWIEFCPDYLPLKYRPRVNESDNELAISQKLAAAMTRYQDDIALMTTYSVQHEDKVEEYELEAKALIEEMAEGQEDIVSALTDIWRDQCAINMAKSRQLWQKREDFLNKKKFEEEANNNCQTVEENWDRPKFKKKGRKQRRHYSGGTE